jgi:hypothetical protein
MHFIKTGKSAIGQSLSVRQGMRAALSNKKKNVTKKRLRLYHIVNKIN